MSKNWIILLAVATLIPLGCLFPQDSPAPAEIPRHAEPTAVKSTINAAVAATIQAVTANTTPTPRPTPTPTVRPTPMSAAQSKPTPTFQPTPTPIPQLTLSPTVRPKLAPVSTAAKRAETITTSLGQQVDVTATGFDDSRLRFNQLVKAINEGERILGVPYPSPRVTMKRVRTLSSGFCGNNQMSYAARYPNASHIVDNSSIEIKIGGNCNKTFNSIAHETAHTWFHGNDYSDWIDEGLANAIEYQVVASYQEGRETYPPVTYCESYSNISELELSAPSRVLNNHATGFSCNYRLGDGIFGELRAYYGDSQFNRRIAQLARREKNDTNNEYTIADVRRVLGGDSPALDIVNRWYGGQPEMRKYRHLDAVKWTHPPTIDGDYIHFAGTTSQPELVQDFVLGKGSYCSQFALYDGIDDQEWIASFDGPLLAGWRHNEIPKIETINHHISPSTGEFSVTARINGDALANISDLSLSVRSRVTAGADGICKESVNYSQAPVIAGQIPGELKATRHYHLDAIEWIKPPTISGNTMRFTGKALPGAVRLTWQEGFCGQFALYERDEAGYHLIDSLRPLLPDNRHWTGQSIGEVTGQRTSADGTFEALVKLSDNALTGYRNPVLLVRTQAAVDRATNKCGRIGRTILSAVDIR